MTSPASRSCHNLSLFLQADPSAASFPLGRVLPTELYRAGFHLEGVLHFRVLERPSTLLDIFSDILSYRLGWWTSQFTLIIADQI